MVKYRYDAWGNCKVLNATGTEITDATHIGILNPFRYRSYYYDTETKLYFLKTRYYDPEIGRFITIDDLSYLDPETVNGLNLYAYCVNNPMAYQDPNGTSLLLTIAILIGALAFTGAAIGGISAAVNGGSVGDVFAGIGMGALAGAMLGISISAIVVGFYVGITSTIGLMTANYGIVATANYVEIAVTQGKRSYRDGDSFWDGVSDVVSAMFYNTPKVLAGSFAIGGTPIWGTKWFSKARYLPSILNDTYELAQYVTMPKAFSFALDGIFWKDIGWRGAIMGFVMNLRNLFYAGKAIFDEPDFANPRWNFY